MLRDAHTHPRISSISDHRLDIGGVERVFGVEMRVLIRIKFFPGGYGFVEIGENPFAVGDVIGLIEVMKSFHEVLADAAGTITAFPADDEEPVMAGQVLAELG